MSHPTRPDLLVLHTLRCMGAARLHRVAAAAGLAPSDVESELIDLAVAGLATTVPGELGVWALTDAGRVADAERIADELATAGTHTTVERAFDGFLVLNPELLDLCTAWQLRSIDGVVTVNDHRDAAYDAKVFALFEDLDQRLDHVCAELSAAMRRFHRYRVRLAGALRRARAGEREYLCDDLDSYHSVWFQLHEDLLATLGIARR
jgi:hypothetical protein